MSCVCSAPSWSRAAASGKSPKPSQHPTRVPLGFFGTVVGNPLFPGLVSNASSPQFANQMDLMEASGVESVRAVFDWSAAQPYSSWSKVPADQQGQFSADGVDNVPTNFDALDTLVADASQRGLTVLPVVIGAPSWDGQTYRGASLAIPRRDAPYANFLAALVKRYGPSGTLWRAESPKLAITSWQIWNEPDVASVLGPASLCLALRRAAAGRPHGDQARGFARQDRAGRLGQLLLEGPALDLCRARRALVV